MGDSCQFTYALSYAPIRVASSRRAASIRSFNRRIAKSADEVIFTPS